MVCLRNLSHDRRFEEQITGCRRAKHPCGFRWCPCGLEDADLVRRARDGDERAFDEIVRRYRAPLVRCTATSAVTMPRTSRSTPWRAPPHACASDPRPIHLRAWLYRVAHNAAINMRARKDFRHEELSLEIDGVPQPPELAAQRTEVREVVSELDRLPGSGGPRCS